MPHPFARRVHPRALYPVSSELPSRARRSNRALGPVLVGFSLLAGLATVLRPVPAAAADWPMFLLNPAHVGISTEALAAPMALDWRFHTSYYQNNPVAPVIVNKTVYLASQSNLYALDAETGEQKWVYPTEGPIGTPTAATIKATPVVDNGTVFVGASDGVLYAIDAATGALKWQYQAGGNIRFSPIVVDGTVYFGSDDYKVYGVDAKTGKPAMDPVKTGNNIIGSPAYFDGLLYFTSADLNLYAYNVGTHRQKFALRTMNSNVYSSPVITDRYIYTVGGNVLYCLLRSGTIRWQYTARNPISNTPLVTDAGVFFGDRGGRFYALDNRGQTMWTITDNASRVMRFSDRPVKATVGKDTYLQLAGAIYSSPILSGSNIYVGTNRGFLYAIDAATGKVNWEYGIFSNLPTGTYPNIAATPAISGGHLYVMSDDGALHCFSPDALDAEKPAITGEVPVRATEMNGTPPIVMGAIVSDEGSGINASSIKMTLDGNPVEYTYQPNSGWVFYRTPVTQPIEPLESGRHTVSLTVSDWKGNTATDSWSFTIDNTLATTVINTPATGDKDTQ